MIWCRSFCVSTSRSIRAVGLEISIFSAIYIKNKWYQHSHSQKCYQVSVSRRKTRRCWKSDPMVSQLQTEKQKRKIRKRDRVQTGNDTRELSNKRWENKVTFNTKAIRDRLFVFWSERIILSVLYLGTDNNGSSFCIFHSSIMQKKKKRSKIERRDEYAIEIIV